MFVRVWECLLGSHSAINCNLHFIFTGWNQNWNHQNGTTAEIINMTEITEKQKTKKKQPKRGEMRLNITRNYNNWWKAWIFILHCKLECVLGQRFTAADTVEFVRYLTLNSGRQMGSRGCGSGESTRLPPMWPGFNSRNWHHAGWVCCRFSSLLA